MGYSRGRGEAHGSPSIPSRNPDKEPFWVNSRSSCEGTLSDMGMMQVLPYRSAGATRLRIHGRSQR